VAEEKRRASGHRYALLYGLSAGLFGLILASLAWLDRGSFRVAGTTPLFCALGGGLLGRRRDLLQSGEEQRSRALAIANVNGARLIAEIEEKNHLIEEAHRQLENSFDEVKKQSALQEIARKRMEAELETARAVQAMLIPEVAKRVRGVDLALSYRSASECGGDWVGFFDEPDSKRVSVLIGDVTGHGVGAALITAGVFAYFSTLRAMHDSTGRRRASDLYDPPAMLRQLDDVVSEMGKQSTFMTLFASVIDYGKRKIRYSNAGHCFPLVISRECWNQFRNAGGSRPSRLNAPPGRILGSKTWGPTPVETWVCRERDVSEGDVVLWYTDGLLENRNPSGDPIGERRLHQWLFSLWDKPIDQVKAGLEDRVAEFLGSRAPDDDIAFVIARIP